jgi:hypothetical protein
MSHERQDMATAEKRERNYQTVPILNATTVPGKPQGQAAAFSFTFRESAVMLHPVWDHAELLSVKIYAQICVALRGMSASVPNFSFQRPRGHQRAIAGIHS